MFVSVVSGSSGGVDFAAPPYTSWKQSDLYYASLIPIGLTTHDDIMAAGDASSSDLWEIPKPYIRTYVLDSGIADAIAMAIDSKNNVYLSQAHGSATGLREYAAPDYNPGPWVATNVDIYSTEGVAALPTGQIAVANSDGDGGGASTFSQNPARSIRVKKLPGYQLLAKSPLAQRDRYLLRGATPAGLKTKTAWASSKSRTQS
jgi:hypothetical protein